MASKSCVKKRRSAVPPKAPSVEEVNTFIFLKCIATSANVNTIEIAMVSVNKKDISRQPGAGGNLPRYKDTLALTFDAARSVVDASEIISAENCFDPAATNVMIQFLLKQMPPACLVAGDDTDFALLKLSLGHAEALNAVNSLVCANIAGDSVDKINPRGTSVESAKEQAIRLLQAFIKTPQLPLCTKFSNVPTLGRTIPLKRFKGEAPLSRVRKGSPPIGETEIETYIFLDLETTGLIKTNPGIGELCMIAVQKDRLSHMKGEALEKILPRRSEECSLMFHPKREFHFRASEVNGLTTQEFEDRSIPSFVESAPGIVESFLDRQKKPLCFVAHNGNSFDFPILREHVKEAKIDSEIWNDIYAADSLLGLRKTRGGEVPRQRGLFSLDKVYQRLVGRRSLVSSADLHTAEGDVLRLIAIARVSSDLLTWMEENKEPFMPK